MESNGALSYTSVVTNHGPAAANGAAVTDPAVANFNASTVSCGTAIGWAACPASPTVPQLQAGLAIPVLPSGGSVTLTLSGTAAVSGAIANVATVAPPAGVTDPTPGNNSSTANTSIITLVDLTISKTGSPNPYVPGALLTYTIVVTNAGPGDATNAHVQDALPAPLAGFSWTCTASGAGASCGTAAGSGSIDALVTLPAGTHATFTVSGTVPAGTIDALANTATVTPPLGVTDPVPGNNSATDNNPVGPQADLTVSKASNPNPYLPGALLTYIVVSNAGPSNVTNARVQDALPAPLAGFTWTCAASGAGAACGTAAGSGNIDALVTLPAGTHATFTVSGTVPAGTTEALTNTATVTPPVGVTDPVPGNNGATNTNPVGPQADLTISKVSSPDPYVPGAALNYTIVVTNAGPSNVTNARVQDALPAPLAGFSWTCVPSGAGAQCGTAAGSGSIDALVTLPAGTHATFTVSGTVPAGTTGSLTNTATVTPPLGVTDPVPGNNGATDTNPAGPQADLTISKVSSPNPYVPGALLTYTIVVSNDGPSNVSNARVQDALPGPLAGFTWTCAASGAGAACGTATGTGSIDALVTLPAGTHATFTVSGTVPAGTTGSLTNTATVTPPLG